MALLLTVFQSYWVDVCNGNPFTVEGVLSPTDLEPGTAKSASSCLAFRATGDPFREIDIVGYRYDSV